MSKRTVVTVNEGKVCGIKEKSIYSGAEYYSFYGIPYARPPVNRLRFKDPVKVKPWTNVYDATHPKTGCFQFSLRLKDWVGTEDCLYNNIYTPKLPSSGDPLKPVVVNIHPGAFVYGSPDPNQYGSPDYLMHRDIVYACIGYRLHVLGFLNLGLKDCSGNQAIKDMLLALQWLKQNIHFFGGDPENITLIGSSSGAVAIHLLMVLPAAKGLFHKAVIMGMYLFIPILDTPHANEDLGFRLGYQLGYSGNENDKKSLLAFLKSAEAKDIVLKARLLEKEKYARIAPFFPNGVFETTIDKGDQAILTVPPRSLIPSTARIPVMFGICENEAVMGFVCGIMKSGTDAHLKTAFRQNCNGWMCNLTDDELNQICDEIESFYLNGRSIQDASLRDKVKIFTDAAYSDVYDTLINLVSADLPSSVFVYKFQFEGTLATLKDEIAPLLPESLEGTFHSCDFAYWARVDDYRQTTAKSDPQKTKKVMDTFTKIISTFARTGDPNNQDLPVRWRPSVPQEPCYLNINDTLEIVDGQLNDERMRFWNNLKKRFSKD